MASRKPLEKQREAVEDGTENPEKVRQVEDVETHSPGYLKGAI